MLFLLFLQIKNQFGWLNLILKLYGKCVGRVDCKEYFMVGGFVHDFYEVSALVL